MQPAGQDPEGASRARNGHSTALFADKCQSFLENVIAQFDGMTNADRTPACAGSQEAPPSTSETEHLRKPADLFCYDNFSDRTVKCLSQTTFVCEPLGQDLRGLRVR